MCRHLPCQDWFCHLWAVHWGTEIYAFQEMQKLADQEEHRGKTWTQKSQLILNVNRVFKTYKYCASIWGHRSGQNMMQRWISLGLRFCLSWVNKSHTDRFVLQKYLCILFKAIAISSQQKKKAYFLHKIWWKKRESVIHYAPFTFSILTIWPNSEWRI